VARPTSISKSKKQRLGKRIAAESPLDPDDQALLRIVFDHYQLAMQEMHGIVEPLVEQFGISRGLDLVVVTSRIKTTKTIREKIRRDHTNLARMDDGSFEVGHRLTKQRLTTDHQLAYTPRGLATSPLPSA
jgi:hypothetical protein